MDLMKPLKPSRGRAGQFFEDFLAEQGALEETTERALGRVAGFTHAGQMKAQGGKDRGRRDPMTPRAGTGPR